MKIKNHKFSKWRMQDVVKLKTEQIENFTKIFCFYNGSGAITTFCFQINLFVNYAGCETFQNFRHRIGLPNKGFTN